ncbi:hypothetical protein F4818DRAFT_262310 [Hypoxylon cercidicola]|nr:hypothetical protein F4818DRAFT_262310 [Hypoxylon cercidicola]
MCKISVDKPTPYFPCNAALGRAFLQDAFFGANLKTAVYFMSQAPGPNVNGESITIMDNYCRSLETSNNDWITSWDGYWTPLPGGPESESSATETPRTKTSTIAGATVGGVAGVMLLAFVGFLVRRYQRYGKGVSLCGLPLIRDKPATYYGAQMADAGSPKSPPEYWPQELIPELLTNVGNTWRLLVGNIDQTAEMETLHVVHEMPANYSVRNSQYRLTRLVRSISSSYQWKTTFFDLFFSFIRYTFRRSFTSHEFGNIRRACMLE